MRSRSNRRDRSRRLRRAFVAGMALAFGGLTGCMGHHAEVPADPFIQQILLPSNDPMVPPHPGLDRPAPADREETAELLPMPRPVEDELPKENPAASPDRLTLSHALELTEQANPRLQFMRARIDQARAGADITFAEFLPTVVAKPRYVVGGPARFIFPSSADQGGVVAFGSSTHEHQLTELHLQWLIFDFGRRQGRYRQATLAAQIADLQFERAVQTAHFNVTAAYFELLRALAVRRIAREAIQRAQQELRDARNLLRRGVIIRNDVLRAEVLLSNAQLERVSAERAVGTARAKLNEAIGINPGCSTVVADSREEPAFTLPLADALGLAVDNRREFAAALDGVRSAQAGREAAHADFMPRVIARGAGNFMPLAQDKGQTLYDGIISIEIGLFEGGRRLSRLHQVDAEIQAAVAQGQEVCNRIALEVQTAWLEVVEARQRVELARTTLTQAAENLRVVRDLFRKGEVRPVELVDAELIFVRAEQDNASALYGYQTSLARLAYAAGIPLEELVGLCPTSSDAAEKRLPNSAAANAKPAPAAVNQAK